MKDWEIRPARDLGLAPLERARSLERETGLLENATAGAWWALTRGYLALWHRLRVEGRAHWPARPPFVVIANHSSHLDALAISAALPARLRRKTFTLAAGDTFFEDAALSMFSSFALNALPMWRRRCGGHALETLRELLLADARGYVLFPEGTRSRDGRLGAFKPGIGRLVAGTEVPVVPCHLAGAHAALAPGRKLPRPGKLVLRVGVPLVFRDTPDDGTGWRNVADSCRAAVAALDESGTTLPGF